MSSPDGTVGGLPIATYYQIRNTYDIQFAAMALTVYDIILTFEREVKLVWRGSWNLASLLYLATRYYTLVESVLNIVTVLDPSLSPGECTSFNLYADIWSIPIIVTLIEAILVLRVCALYGNTWRIKVTLWSLLAGSFITTATLSGVVSPALMPIASPVPSVVGCFFFNDDLAERLLSMIWIPSLVVEVILFGLTALRTFQHVRAQVRTPVLTVILKDGCLYFFTIFALMLLNAVFYGVPNQTGAYEAAFLEPELCISSVLCSRLFLNLRQVLYRHKTEDRTELHTDGSMISPEEYEFGDVLITADGNTRVGGILGVEPA
ncbi:hypothetical protein CALCODRAFT_95397 [Calocera cornea HHB12733]|uniref:DUF6533 domain-containing protein n=1 Tax=Calocera cornea HHB12733 TaxID=1353952 RepID=A0A165IJ41_9BASI|nr:hypothetical protein CALCODRAFT_95397 [Calocera cornea HHB12733]